ncbi:rod shape-determining protein MreC [beta proteobacterium MWH-UniP1]
MALSQSPPPLFKQGLSARFQLLIAVSAAAALIYVDLHFSLLKPLRQGLSVVLYPIEQVLLAPRAAFSWLGDYAGVIVSTVDRQNVLAQREVQTADQLLQIEQLRAENEGLRGLLDLRKAVKQKTLVAEISHEMRDAFSSRVVIDRGSQHGIAPGHPVINAQGVVGQVVRVSPITAEVSLVTDPSLVIPVSLPRSSSRTVAVGAGDGQQVELRYLNINAEVEPGDILVTSGLDGLYPPGLPVAKVSRVKRAGSGQFSNVLSAPVAPVGTLRHVLVIMVDASLIPPAPRDLDKAQPAGKKPAATTTGTLKK